MTVTRQCGGPVVGRVAAAWHEYHLPRRVPRSTLDCNILPCSTAPRKCAGEGRALTDWGGGEVEWWVAGAVRFQTADLQLPPAELLRLHRLSILAEREGTRFPRLLRPHLIRGVL